MLIAFRAWRQTRPFWGGLLIAVGAAEILATTVVSLGPTFRVGLGGVNAFTGIVVTVVLGLCGLLLWFSPGQRAFCSIVSVILALATFNTINYGGFFVGMLLGIVGGAMAFAWSPEPALAPTPAQPRPGSATGRPLRGWFWRQGHVQGHIQGQAQSAPTGGRDHLLTIAAAPLAGLLLLAPALPGQRVTSGPPKGCILVILCPPTRSPSPSPSPSRSPGPSPTPSPTPSRTANPGGSSPSPAPTASTPGSKVKGKAGRTTAPPGLVASAVPAVLTAGTARLTGLVYHGVAEIPRASGGPVTMMKFTLTSVTLTGNPTLTVDQKGSITTTSTSLLSFSGDVVIYTTRLSGDLLGVPVTLTPDSPLPVVARLLRPLTHGLTVTMTRVVTAQPITFAALSHWDNVHIRVS